MRTAFRVSWLCSLLMSAALAHGETDRLVASDALAGAGFGKAVALDGATALVGAYNHGSSGPFFYDGPGAAYIYQPGPGGFTEAAQLTASDAAVGDWFGSAVALSGNQALIGAPADDDRGSSSGSAYIFRFNGTAWVEEAKLTASDGAREHLFGTAVAIDGDLAVVGARENNLTGPGRAYVFRFDGTDWNEEAELLASDGGARDDFGISVGVSGEVVAVGAWNHGNTGASFPDGTGAAYVFRFNSALGTWDQEAKLVSTAPLAGERDRFGRSVAIRGETLAVGTEPINFLDPAPAGSAYIFRFDGSNWLTEAKLVASDAEPGDRFGYSVSLGAGVALVGAWGEWSVDSPCTQNPPHPGVCNSGSAYLFRLDDNAQWTLETKLVPSDIAGGDLFGWSVAVSGDVALSGSWRDGDAGPDSGSAYLFSVAPPWTDLGFNLAGSCGTPALAGSGSLLPGATVTFSLENSCANALGLLVLGLDRIDAPLRGGLLVPRPDLLLPFPTNGLGGFEVTATVSPNMLPGTNVFLQAWVPDTGAPAGYAASNAITARAP